jgi:hypothetical protein
MIKRQLLCQRHHLMVGENTSPELDLWIAHSLRQQHLLVVVKPQRVSDGFALAEED